MTANGMYEQMLKTEGNTNIPGRKFLCSFNLINFLFNIYSSLIVESFLIKVCHRLVLLEDFFCRNHSYNIRSIVL